jgi:2-methoxy-6-polyprenyl-1,4-benzoquinol methylase
VPATQRVTSGFGMARFSLGGIKTHNRIAKKLSATSPVSSSTTHPARDVLFLTMSSSLRRMLVPVRDAVAGRARFMSSTGHAGFGSGSKDEAESPDAAFDRASGSTTTSFGFKDVLSSEKEGLVREVFEKVAPSYDLMNDLMSAGVHRVWKDYLVSKVGVFPGMTHLDVAGGTGDVAFRVLRALRAEEASKRRLGGGGKPRNDPSGAGRVVVSDINPFMLREGEKRSRKFGLGRATDARGNPVASLEFVEGNAEKLPFPDNSIDTYTIAFGLRNVTNTLQALKDAHRLLKPGGRFFCLEFSHVKSEPLKTLYEAYSFNVIPALGDFVAKDRESYQYLVESIRKFPKQEKLQDMMLEAGFKSVDYENLTGGVCAIHSGFKME